MGEVGKSRERAPTILFNNFASDKTEIDKFNSTEEGKQKDYTDSTKKKSEENGWHSSKTRYANQNVVLRGEDGKPLKNSDGNWKTLGEGQMLTAVDDNHDGKADSTKADITLSNNQVSKGRELVHVRGVDGKGNTFDGYIDKNIAVKSGLIGKDGEIPEKDLSARKREKERLSKQEEQKNINSETSKLRNNGDIFTIGQGRASVVAPKGAKEYGSYTFNQPFYLSMGQSGGKYIKLDAGKLTLAEKENSIFYESADGETNLTFTF
jgi:hypothetical protein